MAALGNAAAPAAAAAPAPEPAPAAEPAKEEAPAAEAASGFSAAYPGGLSDNVKTHPEWIQLGCGDSPYNCPEKQATFAVDGKAPDDMPDLSKHSNFMAEYLVANPQVYAELKDKTTSQGTTFAQIIKTGV